MSDQEEIWKDIEGYEGKYQVSNLGRVKKIYKTVQEKIIKSHIHEEYCVIGLYKNSRRKSFRLHRLLAKAFIQNIDNKPYINHINGIKHDNRLENLEWVTQSENTQHAYDTGLAHGNNNIFRIKSGAGQNHHCYKGEILGFLNGEHIVTLYGPKDMREKGFNPAGVCGVLKGRYKHHKGLTFTRNNRDLKIGRNHEEYCRFHQNITDLLMDKSLSVQKISDITEKNTSIIRRVKSSMKILGML